MDDPPRTNLADIALALGVSRATVSLALRNDPRCNAETRKRVQKQAAAMNYCPDPHLSALSAYRMRNRARVVQATIGMLLGRDTFEMTSPSGLSRHLEAQAHALGYGMDRFVIPTSPAEGLKLTTILKARGITGLIVRAGRGRLRDVPLDWARFHVVSVSGRPTRSGIPSVTTNYFSAAEMTMDKLASAGYRRPLVVMDSTRGLGREVVGAARASRELFDRMEEADIRDITPPGKLEDLILRKKPDAVVFLLEPPWALPRIRAAGWRVPEDLGFCGHIQGGNPENISGTMVASASIAAAAMSLLHREILHSEHPPFAHPPSFQISTDWNEGTTL